MYQALLKYSREVQERHGYTEIAAPLVNNKKLWLISGHWAHYVNNMFMVPGVSGWLKADAEIPGVLENLNDAFLPVVNEAIYKDVQKVHQPEGYKDCRKSFYKKGVQIYVIGDNAEDKTKSGKEKEHGREEVSEVVEDVDGALVDPAVGRGSLYKMMEHYEQTCRSLKKFTLGKKVIVSGKVVAAFYSSCPES